MTTGPSHPPSLLLSLPTELIALILSFLPLSSALILRLQTCKSLRDPAHLGRFRIPGSHPHTLSLAEWHLAAIEIRDLGLAECELAFEGVGPSHQSCPTSPSRPAVPELPSVDTSQPSDFPTWSSSSRTQQKNSNEHDASPSDFASRIEALSRNLDTMLTSGPAQDGRLFRRICMFLGLLPHDAEWFHKIASRTRAGASDPLISDSVTALPEELRPWSGTGRSSDEDDDDEGDAHTLRCVSLISWYGLSGEILTHLLRTCDAFSHVKLIVKTDRFDADAWRTLYHPRPRGRPSDVVLDPTDYESGGGIGERQHDVATDAQLSPYAETQLAVHVGSKADDDVPIKGKGLFAGYKAFCFAPASDTSPMHVIFQGRFPPLQAVETEEMLELSTLQCKYCNRHVELQ